MGLNTYSKTEHSLIEFIKQEKTLVSWEQIKYNIIQFSFYHTHFWVGTHRFYFMIVKVKLTTDFIDQETIPNIDDLDIGQISTDEKQKEYDSHLIIKIGFT